MIGAVSMKMLLTRASSGASHPVLSQAINVVLSILTLPEPFAAGAEAVAAKRVLPFQIEKEMKRKGLTKVQMATRMRTSRTAVDRLLDPENSSVTLNTL
jgi:hypothetical protein